MNAAVWTLALAVLAGADPIDKTIPRRPSPLAPSLPELTKEEEEKLDQIIDRFMLYDIGRLQGEDARSALRDFQKLGPEAIPALLRGLNRAAAIEHSCPCVVIAQKLQRLLLASDDRELLQLARDEIGAGVGRTRHATVLQDLRLKVTMRQNLVARRPPPAEKPTAAEKAPAFMSNSELAEAAGNERGPRLEKILTELERRKGPEVLAGLATATANSDRKSQELARDLLDRHLGRQPQAVVRQKLKDTHPEVRQAAVRVAAAKMPNLGGDVIDLLDDEVGAVRAAARQALVLLSRGEDFGPEASADKATCAEAQKKWRDWWDRRSGR
jgi:hypothetical protein